MRAVVVVIALCGAAHADDQLAAGVAVGAGGQGAATYGAVELTLDADWHDARLGLGARGVWLDGELRTREWSHASAAVTVVRLLELHSDGRAVALAAGNLAPLSLADLADGYRTALDDRPRTGARASVALDRGGAELAIDDVLDPAVAGGAASVRVTPRWLVRGGALVDPQLGEAATELAIAHTWQAEHARGELGGGLAYEPGRGAHAIVAGAIERERGDARLAVRADLRAGTGTVGGAFGALYRLERSTLWDRSGLGFGAGIAASIAAPSGWLTASVRVRPERGVIGSVSAGAPMGRYVQAAGWAAASRDAAAGAAELRVAWASRLASALQVARMYDSDAMDPSGTWSITAWFQAATR